MNRDWLAVKTDVETMRLEEAANYEITSIRHGRFIYKIPHAKSIIIPINLFRTSNIN